MVKRIWSWLVGLFKRNSEEDMININTDACSSSVIIKEDGGLDIVATVSPLGGVVSYPICCGVCDTPQITSDIYDGASFIPFSLDMPDGTKVVEVRVGGFGYVYDGRGVIELNEPLSTGSTIQLSVNESGCNVIGEPVKVKRREDNCECLSPSSDCNIAFKSFQAETFGNSFGKITNIEIDSSSDVYYRIGDSPWVDDISLLPVLIPNRSVSLGIKSKSDPSCRREVVIGVVRTSDEGVPSKPIVFTDKNEVFDGETANLTAACSIGSPLWSNGSTANSIEVGVGAYSAKCVNQFGESESSESIVISEADEPLVLPVAPTISSDKIIVGSGELATLSGTCEIGSISWSIGGASPTIQVGAGTYTATCVNALGSSPLSSPIVITQAEDDYGWALGSWGSCLNGFEQRVVRCLNSVGEVVDDSFCSVPKPVEIRPCVAPSLTPTNIIENAFIVSGSEGQFVNSNQWTD